MKCIHFPPWLLIIAAFKKVKEWDWNRSALFLAGFSGLLWCFNPSVTLLCEETVTLTGMTWFRKEKFLGTDWGFVQNLHYFMDKRSPPLGALRFTKLCLKPTFSHDTFSFYSSKDKTFSQMVTYGIVKFRFFCYHITKLSSLGSVELANPLCCGARDPRWCQTHDRPSPLSNVHATPNQSTARIAACIFTGADVLTGGTKLPHLMYFLP